jgi:hypothetical protein
METVFKVKMETVFKVGDRVYCALFGWGKIYKIYHYGNFPVKVVSENDGSLLGFSLNGCFFNDSSPILSFTEYTLQGFTQERPINLPEVGELCLVSDGENRTWILKEFICYKPEATLPYITKGDVPYRLLKRIKILD